MNNDFIELLKSAKTGDEAKQIIDRYKGELSDDELKNVIGGINEENARISVMGDC